MNSKKSTKVNLVSSLVIWFIVVNVNLSSAEQFAVYSSSSSMTVDIGEGAFINCYLKPEVSAVDMEIQWIRVNDGSVIYKYRKGMEENHQAYNGRIKLVKTGIEKGNVTLEMHNIQPSDKGLYTCYFQNNFMFDEARIEILPRAIGTSPVLLMETDALNLKVSCSSSGWYPKPDGQWLSEDEKKVTELSKSIQKTEDGLYNINISIMFTEESKRTCVIQNSYPEHPINVSLYLSDSVFPKSNTGHIVAHALLTLIIIGMVSCIAVHKNKEKKRKAIKKEFKQAMKHSVDVCLDPETAHPDLRISDDLKCLSRTLERQKVPDNEKRFDTRLYVLGKEPLSNDQKYWKVNVEDATHWTIGVAYENINRKGKLNISPDEGIWVLELDGGIYKVYEDHPINIKVPKGLRHIGIYINLPTGKVAFYDADKGLLIYSFKKKLGNSASVYPFFSVWTIGENIRVCSLNCPTKDSDENTRMLLYGEESPEHLNLMDRCLF